MTLQKNYFAILCALVISSFFLGNTSVSAQNSFANTNSSFSVKNYNQILNAEKASPLSSFTTLSTKTTKEGEGGYEKGRITLGAGLGYGLDVSKPSIGIRAQYFFTEKIAAQVGFSSYLMGEEGFSYREIDLNVNYYFPLDGSLQPYALAGLGFATVTVEFLGEKATASNTGFNIGGGADYLFSEKLCAFGELRYVASEAGQVVIQAGVRYAIK